MIILLLLPTWAVAQDSDEDKGFITTFLQDNLSDAGRTVTIDGFAGALSSQASMDRMTIADDAGTWFIIEDVVLDWNRLALFKGRLDVNELSAGTIRLLRMPASPNKPTNPEATVFQLPDLPVSIDITALRAGRIVLDEPVLGETITATLSGGLQLDDGAGAINLALTRTDAKTGVFKFAGAYANETNVLDIELALNEGKDGILATALDLPGTPPLDFKLTGHDPLTDFTASIHLGADGTPRFTGTVEVKESVEVAGATNFSADLGGDISPLFDPDYQPFFGTDTSLLVDGSMESDGRLILNTLSLNTAALDLSGSLTLSKNRLPEQFNITGSLHNAGDVAALLPLPGAPVQLASAEIGANFQASKNNQWSFDARFSQFSKDTLHITSGKLSASGIIDLDETAKRSVTADITAILSGLSSDDPALAKAMGTEATAKSRIIWQDDAPLEIQSLEVTAGGTDLTGHAKFVGYDKNMRITGDVALVANDLDRFSDLLDMPIGGQADVSIAGWIEPLGGAFDATVSGHSTDLVAGPDPLPDLLKGAGTLDIAIKRDLNGVHLKNLGIKTDAVSISANGNLASGAGDLKFDTTLADVSTIVTGLSGPANLTGTLRQTDGPWTVDARAKGPAGSNLALSGTVGSDASDADLAMKGSFPLGLANNFLPSNILIGGNGDIDLRLNGPVSLNSLSGQVSTSGASVSMPTFNMSLADLSARATLANNVATIEARTNVAQGGHILATGSINLASPYTSNLDVTLNNVAYAIPPTVKTRFDGNITLSGPLTNRPTLSGSIDLRETDLFLASTGGGGQIPDMVHVGEPSAVRITRHRAGFDQQESEANAASATAGMNLDAVIHAPGKIFIRGSGLNAEMRGDLRITGTTLEIIPVGQFNLVRGHLDLFGRRLDLVEGELFLQGTFDPYFTVAAQTRTDNATVRVVVKGNPDSPDISFESNPDMPEEEILAELLFGKSLSEMSPAEAASLASKVAGLAGGGGGRLSEGLRQNLGLDSFGVTTSQEGNVALRAGKYVSDNLYTDIVVDSEGHSRIDLNLDITSDFTARGSTDNRGNTGIGIFFEKDY